LLVFISLLATSLTLFGHILTKGISQSLIIARIGLSRLQGPAVSVSKHTAIMFTDSSRTEVKTELVIKGGALPVDAELNTTHSMGNAPTASHENTLSVV
jgi:hypothetical protein